MNYPGDATTATFNNLSNNLQDLVDDDVMVLDSGHEIYVWVGLHSTDQEREAGFGMAQVTFH